MNIYPLLAPISVGLGILVGYVLIGYISRKMGKPFPGIGELMFPMHHKDSKIDKRHRKGKS
ncbi:MAG TPA: hypothetical protein QGI59_00905 [Candidatus Poseidoniia archaeon]|jgi:hypothetical protein|nr:hypothetical protein [Candidatus Poseidoniia archaeon]|tara:strand:+ start:578 stop:760 length:183 start_codon:yes stop_codon:yes gene_type:complete